MTTPQTPQPPFEPESPAGTETDPRFPSGPWPGSSSWLLCRAAIRWSYTSASAGGS